MPGTSQRDRAARDADGGPSESGHRLRDRTVRRDPGRSASWGVELSLVDVRDATEIERAVTTFARTGNGSLIVTASGAASRHRDLIIMLAARHLWRSLVRHRRW